MPQPFLVDPALPIHQLKTQPFASSSFASCAVAVSFSAHEIERRPVLRKAQVINKKPIRTSLNPTWTVVLTKKGTRI